MRYFLYNSEKYHCYSRLIDKAVSNLDFFPFIHMYHYNNDPYPWKVDPWFICNCYNCVLEKYGVEEAELSGVKE